MLKLKRVFLYVFVAFLTLSFVPSSLCADIVFKGVCGSYYYDLNVSATRYYGAFCDSGSLKVYWDTRIDQIVTAYYNNGNLVMYDYNQRVVRLWDNLDTVTFIGEPSFHFLAGLAGLLIGLSFLYVVMRLV